MVILPVVPIDAPIPGRLRAGLFLAAGAVGDLPARAGGGAGVAWVPTACGAADTLAVACYAGAVTPVDKPIGETPDTVETGSFVVMAARQCPDPSIGVDASAALMAGEQGAVERAFWTGLDHDGGSLTVLNLTDTDTSVGAGVTSVVAAVSALETYAYTTSGYGYDAVIHAPVGVAAYAAEAALVVRDGARLRTPFGSVWAFGGGYPTADPFVMHVTGQVRVWRGPVLATQVFDQRTNQHLAVAERAYAVGYECFNGSINLDVTGA